MGNETRRRRGTKGRTDRRWVLLAARLKDELPPVCWICGLWIDKTLDHRHKMSFTLDHVISLDEGGDPYDEDNIRPAHRSCNGRRGAEYGNKRKGAIGLTPLPRINSGATRFSRRW